MNERQMNNEMYHYVSLNGEINHDTHKIHKPMRQIQKYPP